MKLELNLNNKDLESIKECVEYLLYVEGNADFMKDNRDFLIELKNKIKLVIEVQE
jgi:predicted phosphodiesterase